MPIDTIVIDSKFRGPDGIGNGGYVSGRLAAYLGGNAEVTLLRPAPLDTELLVKESDAGKVVLLHHQQLIAEARPVTFDLDIPGVPGLEEAIEARTQYSGHASHPAPNCFVCGPARTDGLHIQAGWVREKNYVACPWQPDAIYANEAGLVNSEFIWAVLDCPGAFATTKTELNYILLGKLAVRQLQPVMAGEQHIVSGWLIDTAGRKYHTGTALFNSSGTLCAMGKGTWIRPRSQD